MMSMKMTESTMAMSIPQASLKTVESLALNVARQAIADCASLYGFSAEEAMERLGASAITLRPVGKKPTAVKPVKQAFPLPFNGTIMSDCCQGVKANRGLYSQCSKACKKDSQFCTTCSKQSEKNASGEPDCGVISKRLSDGEAWRDPKGRAPISFAKLMKKLKLTQEQVLAEIDRLGVDFDAEKHFAEEPAKETKRGRPKKAITSDTDSESSSPKKRGRPKKAAKVLEVSASEDLFASLVESAKTAAPKADESDLSGSDSDSEAGSKKGKKLSAAEKEAKALAKAQAKATKDAEKAQAKAQKDAEKALAKAQKEAEKAEVAAAAKATKEAEKVAKALAKAEAKEAEKAAKATKAKAKVPAAGGGSAASEELTAESEDDEPVVKVEKFEFKGVKYLKSASGEIYDAETQEEIGVWNNKTKEIEMHEDSDSDSDDE
jgi:hypothetical protein